MKSIKKRLEKLENRTMPQKTVYLMVGWEVPGETEEEAWERHLREHPEDKDATNKILFRFVGWLEEYAHENKIASKKTGKGN
jgi:hypothetical protein